MNKVRASARLQQILELLATQPEVGVVDLADRFGVTTMTIRRDLDLLTEQGRVIRTHGGAVPAAPAVAEFAFHERRQARMQQKRAIARAAAECAGPGMSVILDTGTTTLEVARALAGIPGLRVLTSSLAIGSALFAHESIELILLGGTVNRGSPDLSGPLTEENLAAFRVDIAFIGADAVCNDGLYTDSQEIARVSRAMIAGANRVILVADSSKLARDAFVRFAEWSDIDTVIMDSGLPPAARRWLRRSVGQVVTVRVADRTGHEAE